MGEPFRGQPAFEGRSVPGKAEFKLAAAKIALLERLPGIGKARIALFAFTGRPTFILDGEANERDRIRDALDQLVPHDGTDIAAALRAASDYASSLPDPGVLRVLVVSDGLSDLEAAEEAARSLAGRGAMIDVILIDPTAEGEAVARAIAIEGEVQAVTTPTGLSEHIGEAAERHAAMERKVNEIVKVYDEGIRAAAARRDPEAEQVRFTVGYPGVISPEVWYPYVAVIHLASFTDEVRKRLDEQFLQQRLLGRHHLAEAGADHPLSRGSELTLVPSVEGLEFNPRSAPITWLEDIQDVTFRFRARPESAGKAIQGVLDVYHNDLVVAGIPFRLHVRSEAEQVDLSAPPQVESGRIYQKVFASYSRHDEDIVNAVVAGYQALGIYVYIDTQALRGRGGQEWSIVLKRFVQDSDLFQLYWSTNSEKSGPVEDEWRFARSLIGQKVESFIRGLVWEESPPLPPAELRNLHFEKLDLRSLHVGSAPRNASKPDTSASVSPVPAAAVVPLIPGTRVAEASAVEGDVRWAVDFLETRTGLRYYPVPTVLVDEYVVREARQELTTEVPFSRRLLVERAVGLGEIVGLAAMEVHEYLKYVRPGPNGNPRDILPLIAATRSFRGGAFNQFRRACEWVPRWMVFEPLNNAGFGEELKVTGGDNRFGADGKELGWQSVRKELAETGTPDIGANQELLSMAEIFLGHLRALLRGMAPYFTTSNQWSPQNWIHEAAHGLLRREAAAIPLEVNSAGPDSGRQPVWKVQAPFPSLVAIADWASSELLAILRSLLDGSVVAPGLLMTETPTFGIFVPGEASQVDRQLFRWAEERAVPRELTLPGRPRVLLCLDALPRVIRKLREEGSAAAADQGRTLQRLVLVHEHAHAIFETGLDDSRRTAPAARLVEAWRGAAPLNESLAVWLELEAVRGQAAYEGWVWEFIRGGNYPAWPYRGAEKIERGYASTGLSGVRELIQRLRRDPIIAQSTFDESSN